MRQQAGGQTVDDGSQLLLFEVVADLAEHHEVAGLVRQVIGETTGPGGDVGEARTSLARSGHCDGRDVGGEQVAAVRGEHLGQHTDRATGFERPLIHAVAQHRDGRAIALEFVLARGERPRVWRRFVDCIEVSLAGGVDLGLPRHTSFVHGRPVPRSCAREPRSGRLMRTVWPSGLRGMAVRWHSSAWGGRKPTGTGEPLVGSGRSRWRRGGPESLLMRHRGRRHL